MAHSNIHMVRRPFVKAARHWFPQSRPSLGFGRDNLGGKKGELGFLAATRAATAEGRQNAHREHTEQANVAARGPRSTYRWSGWECLASAVAGKQRRNDAWSVHRRRAHRRRTSAENGAGQLRCAVLDCPQQIRRAILPAR